MKDYYQILRISRQASGDEIKRAYRRLAVVFHPDKNQSEESSALFQEINEAHEVLADPDKRWRYDQLLSSAFTTDTTTTTKPWHRDPAYRRKYQPGYKPPAPAPSERLLMMVHFLKYFRLISFIGIGWCAFLLFDYLLPFRISEEKVVPESNRKISWQFHHVPYVIVTDKGHQFPISSAGVEYFPEGSNAEIVTTRILNVLVRVEAGNNDYTINNLATVYNNFLFIPIILLVVSVTGLTLKQGIEFRFSFEVTICVILFFNLLFLIFSIL